MHAETETEKLTAWYNDQREHAGVVDIKFCLNKSDESTTEAVCREVNAAIAGKPVLEPGFF